MKKFGRYLFIFIVLFSVMGITVAAFYMLYPSNKEKNTKVNQEAQTDNIQDQYYPLKPFHFRTANDKNMTITLDLELSIDLLRYELNAQNKKVRQTIKDILITKNSYDLYTIDGKNIIEREIKKALNNFLVDGKIVNVYIITDKI